MMRRRHASALLALMMGLVLSGCGGDAPRESAEPAGGTTTEGSIEVRAAAIADAIEANPAAADSILAAHGMSRDSFETLLFEIAADAAANRLYRFATAQKEYRNQKNGDFTHVISPPNRQPADLVFL